jgi:aminopeptidase N
MRVPLALVVLLLSFNLPARASDSSPRDLLAALNSLHLDGQRVYTVSPPDRIQLREGDMLLSFEQGKMAFFEPFEGRVTGFVFSGIGHCLALPREQVEKQQLARFLGAPVLDQQFVSIYARFTDDAAQDLFGQMKRASLEPASDENFASLWLPQLQRLNVSHSVRILVERYSTAPRHFFHAGIDGILTGPFDVLLDHARAEDFLIGQPRAVENLPFYDVWVSYSLPHSSPPPPAFHALHYQVSTTVRTDNSIEGDASVEFRAAAGGESTLTVLLARALKVESVSLASGENLPFLQNEGLTEKESRSRGNDLLHVILPRAPQPGDTFALRFRYRGNVIENYGNSVLFVGAREGWYPHFGDTAEFSQFDLFFRWPRNLRLVATGEKSEEREDGEFRTAHWKSEQPVPEAGFNLGEYAFASIPSSNRTVEVYANKLLEQAIVSRLSQTVVEPPRQPLGGRTVPLTIYPPVVPSPADALKSLASEVDASISFFEKFGGPFPFRHLAVSQIPGTFGQGWPGLLYLSTFSFLPPETQEQVGVNAVNQEAFTDIVPVHEVAHQWWGNVVGWSSYRDQWINEGLAVYLAVLFAESQKTKYPDRTLNTWLSRYRKRLLTKSPDSDLAPADIGPVTMGLRLASSRSLDAYDVVVYSKGAWIYHMLRQMLRQPDSRDPDARFVSFLRSLAAKYAQKTLSTEQLQKEVEAVMTPRMDLEGGRSMAWFFEEYVRGTGIPHYKVEFTSRRTEKGFQVRGKLYQSGVPRSFIAPVPLHASSGAGRGVLLGTVVTSGDETSFSFTAKTEPRKLLIDPYSTLLCVAD